MKNKRHIKERRRIAPHKPAMTWESGVLKGFPDGAIIRYDPERDIIVQDHPELGEVRLEIEMDCAHCGESFEPANCSEEHCPGCVLIFQKEDRANGIEPRTDYSLRALTTPKP